MFVAIYNSCCMNHAKERYKRWPAQADYWEQAKPLSWVIDEAVLEAKHFNDSHKPKIFIVKD